jgi:F-type H+-transporting ATPase subunit b
MLGLALLIGPTARVLAAGPSQEPAAQPASEAAHPAEAPHADAAGHAGGEAHGEAGGTPNILELKPPLAVATLIVFLLLLAVLWKTAWGPLAKALDERERQQEENVRQAEHARAESERLLAEHRALIAQAQDQVRGILEEARRDAESTANDILQKAQAEAEAGRSRAERDIVQARDQALAEIWTRTADLAVTVAGKVLSREIGPDEQRRLVAAATDELPAAPDGRGGSRV